MEERDNFVLGVTKMAGLCPYVMQYKTRKYPTTNKLYFQNKDVLTNLRNPVNPDSKINYRKHSPKTYDRFSSLHWTYCALQAGV